MSDKISEWNGMESNAIYYNIMVSYIIFPEATYDSIPLHAIILYSIVFACVVFHCIPLYSMILHHIIG